MLRTPLLRADAGGPDSSQTPPNIRSSSTPAPRPAHRSRNRRTEAMAGAMRGWHHDRVLEGRFAGRWWLPEDPDRSWGGFLTLAPNEPPTLHIAAAVSDIQRRLGAVVVEHPSIVGITADGKAVTLVAAAEAGGQMNLFAPEAGDTIITAPRAYIGDHFRRESDARFRRLILKVSRLDSWFPPRPIDRQIETRGRRLARSVLTYEPAPDVVVDLGFAKLEFGHDFAARGNLRTEATLTQSATVVATTNRKQPLDWWLRNVVKPLRYLLTLSTELPTAVTNIRLSPWAKAEGRTVEVVWDEDLPADDRGELHQAQMLVWFGDLIDRFEPALQSWARSVDQLEEVLDQFFATFHPSRSFVETRFTMTVSAAEAYHRRRIGGTDAPPDIHRERARQARRGVDRVYLDWLNQRIASNEPTLLRRVHELCQSVPEVTALVVGADIESFGREVRDARNFRTHLDDARAGAPANLHLVRLTSQLAVILEAAILKMDLGFETAAIAERMARSSRLRRLAAQLVRAGH